MKIIQIDVCPEELGQNVRSEVGLLGDCALITNQLISEVKREGWSFKNDEWWNILKSKVNFFTIFLKKALENGKH